MELFNQIFNSDNYALIIGVSIAVLVLWFLPAMLALIFNRKHFKLILLACVPAGFSVIAWSGVLVWAVSGKVVKKFAPKSEISS
ncbi:superinfection immunity protein [Parashewanella curva]|uniref:Superinfection immunity protein n=1 Tax=Parashewanella curva TaxID=2338552 RepID=A0A3L8Q0B1_9GAMM|nr:superinfection immunity protein [Parashewanella curva]RLV60860.1 superinfection immunity protein [Parashewanella curva]